MPSLHHHSPIATILAIFSSCRTPLHAISFSCIIHITKIGTKTTSLVNVVVQTLWNVNENKWKSLKLDAFFYYERFKFEPHFRIPIAWKSLTFLYQKISSLVDFLHVISTYDNQRVNNCMEGVFTFFFASRGDRKTSVSRHPLISVWVMSALTHPVT